MRECPVDWERREAAGCARPARPTPLVAVMTAPLQREGQSPRNHWVNCECKRWASDMNIVDASAYASIVVCEDGQGAFHKRAVIAVLAPKEAALRSSRVVAQCIVRTVR
eukprot:Opistho-2@6558